MATETIDTAALELLVSPWLPNATVDSVRAETECGCYSEFTTDPTRFEVTFKAPRPTGEGDVKLSKLVSVIEGVVRAWAQRAFNWRGCECCCDEDHLNEIGYVDVRIIRTVGAVDPVASR